MSYTYHERIILYRLDQVYKELGIDLLTWSKLIAEYDLSPKMTAYRGYRGMTLEEKNRLVRELRERLAAMPELLENMEPAGAYPCIRQFDSYHTLYSYAEVVEEALPILDEKVVEKIMQGYKPSVAMVEHNGHNGFDEAGKNQIMAELKKRRAQYEAEERERYLNQLAAIQGTPLTAWGMA